MSDLLARISADAARFTDLATWGTAATWRRPGLADVTVNLAFDQAGSPESPAGALLETTAPQAVLCTADAPTLAAGHILIVAGTLYHVVAVRADSFGMTFAELSTSEMIQPGLQTDGAGNVLVDGTGFPVTLP
jgi:hypothetical protein